MWNLHTLGVSALITLALSAGSAWYAYSKGKQSGMHSVQTLWDSEKRDLMAANTRAQQAALAKQKQAEAAVSLAQQEKVNEIRRINARHAAVVDSLRNRPEARAGAGGMPETPAAGTGCTGEGLARPDAAFLAGYSADVAKLQAALDTCKAGYRALGGEVID